MPAEDLVESNFVSIIHSKDSKKFHVLYDAYSPALYSILLQLVKFPDVAEDLLQNVFIKIWKNSDRYCATKGRIYTWFMNIARNEAIDYLRTNKVNFRTSQTMIHTEAEPLHTNDEQEFIRRADTVTIMRVLDIKERNLLELVRRGYSFKQISILMNMPEGSVKTKIRASYKKMRLQFPNYVVEG